MKNSTVIKIPSHAKYLCVVRSVTEKMGELYGMTAPEIEDVKLAVDEACANAIKHACKGNEELIISVKYNLKRKGFEVVIDDSGQKARPDAIKGRDLDDVRPGGLGVHLIKRVFDVFAFDEKKKNGNRLRLVRHRRINPPEADK